MPLNFMNAPYKISFAAAVCVGNFSTCVGVLTAVRMKVKEIIKRMPLLTALK